MVCPADDEVDQHLHQRNRRVDWVAWAWEWTGDSDMRSPAGSQATN